MLKLHQYFLRSTLWILIFSFFITALFSYYFAKQSEIESAKSSLRNIVNVASLQRDLNSSYLAELAQSSRARVSYIDKHGRVLYDSEHNSSDMENHLARPEIQEAKLKGIGASVRYSSTLKRDLIYVAKQLPNGYLRLAYPQRSIYNSVVDMMAKILIYFLILIALLLYFSGKINSRISSDSKKIDSALDALLKKDFSIYLGDVSCCKEFTKIAKKIQKVAKQLKKRQRQKDRYTKRLKEITKRQGDIISAISHEFKNPVAAIIGYAQTIKETPDLDDSLKKKFIDKIESNAHKISTMIDTLALSIKLESKAIVLNKEEFNIAELAKSTKEMLKQKYRDREIILECEDVMVKADRNMLENVFINMIENALKYSEDEVVVKCSNGRVEVIDSGIGISANDIEKIKEKFYRVDGISWNNSIGVGLYIVDYILKLHKLELEIKSQKGKGSVFGFEIKKILVK